MSNTGPAAITIAPPADVLFPFDGVDPMSTSPVSPIPAPPGFAPIGPVGYASVIMDTLATSGFLSTKIVGFVVHLGGCCHRVRFSQLLMNPVRFAAPHRRPFPYQPLNLLTGSLSLPVSTVPDVSSSPVVSSSCRSSTRSLSPDSERSDGSFRSGRTGPFGAVGRVLIVGQAPCLPCFLSLHSFRLCVGKDLLRRRPPTLGLGVKRVVVPTGSRPTGIMILLSMMDTLVYSFTTRGFWSGSGLRNLPTYCAGTPANGSSPHPGYKPSMLRANYNMTRV